MNWRGFAGLGHFERIAGTTLSELNVFTGPRPGYMDISIAT
jgi:hypothetical protein